MAKFKITLVEKVVGDIEVEAKNRSEATHIAREMIRQGQVPEFETREVMSTSIRYVSSA